MEKQENTRNNATIEEVLILYHLGIITEVAHGEVICFVSEKEKRD